MSSKTFMKRLRIIVPILFLFTACSSSDTEPELNLPTFSILGDSISTLKGCVPKGYPVYYSSNNGFDQMKMWWYGLSELLSIKLSSNSSYAGATVSRYNNNPDSWFFSDTRIENLSMKGEPDYVIIFGGTNDWSRGVAFESNERMDSTTFSGAYRLMLHKIKNYYPDTKIICFSVLARKEGIDTENASKWTIRKANDRIRSICKECSCAFIDLSSCGFSEDINGLTIDGLHPNVEGFRRISLFAANGILKAIEEDIWN